MCCTFILAVTKSESDAVFLWLLFMMCVCFSGCSSRTRTWIMTSRSRSQAMLSPPQSRREATKGLKPTLPPGVSFIHLIALSCHSFPHILSSCPPCTFPPCSWVLATRLATMAPTSSKFSLCSASPSSKTCTFCGNYMWRRPLRILREIKDRGRQTFLWDATTTLSWDAETSRGSTINIAEKNKVKGLTLLGWKNR